MLSRSDEQKEKGKGFLRSFFRSKKAAEPADDNIQEVQQEIQQEIQETALAESAPPKEEKKLEVSFPAGTLLTKAWEKWRGDSCPLALSLCGTDCSLPFSSERAATESTRLSALLEKEAEQYLQLLEQQEAKNEPEESGIYKIYLSADCMAAWAFLFPPFQPQQKAEKEVFARLMEESGVTTGIDTAAVDYLCREQPYFELVLLACGTPPVEGTDGSIKELYPRQITNEVKINDNGTADYHTRNYMQPIQKGDVICEIIPPQQGVAGVRVDGQTINPQPVKAAKVMLGANTVLSEDGQQVIAKIDGHLEYHSAFAVRSSLEIHSDVDYSTGDINYQGDVHISGSVRAGFSVRVAGTVIVDGMVEAARIEAGGDVIVASGILGDANAFIKSGSNVRAKYLENCTVYAGKGVYTDCAISSRIGSDDCVVVTTGRGTIIGGTVTAGKVIKAHIVGSNSGRKTNLVLGALPYTEQERTDCESALQNIDKERQSLEKGIQNVGLGTGKGGEKEQTAKVNLRKSVLNMKEKKLTERLKKLEGLTADISQSRFEGTRVYPVTQLTVLEYSHIFEEVKNSCIATFDIQNREIRLR